LRLGLTDSILGFRDGSLVKKIALILIVVAGAAVLLSLSPGPLMAKVTGRCDNCHTMHFSQNGSAPGLPGFPTTPPYDNWTATTPQRYLLVNSCIGCHTGTNNGSNIIPYVLDTVQPTFGVNTLAGGNFYWVAQGPSNDPKGHNVMDIRGAGVDVQDTNIDPDDGAPGNQVDFGACQSAGCHGTLAAVQSVLPELGSGCEGCHIDVGHHANDGTGTKFVGSYPWYRFLAGHTGDAPNDTGVKGIEQERWNYNADANEHNEYLGVSGEGGGGIGITGRGNMSAYCAGCHGDFHLDQTEGALWIRHPSDFVIPDSGEYQYISTTYNPMVPVARSEAFLTGLGDTPDSTVAAGRDMVMCLSCHVSHGSPYDDLLRWDYSTMVAGGGDNTTGCFVCHTQKDDT
jgi:predicted CXXCH cytochrome family protein